MRRIASADLAPPGSLIRPAHHPPDPSRDVTVRFPDGSGWHVDGHTQENNLPLSAFNVGWPWKCIGRGFDGECTVLAENLSESECLKIAIMSPADVSAWLMDRQGGAAVTTDDTIRDLRREIDNMRVAAERRNRQLDALGVVWCDGGCTGGMHRFSPDRAVTAQQIADLIVNAGRAVDWFVNHAGRVHDRASDRRTAWDGALAELQAATPEAFRMMVDRAATISPRPEQTSVDAPLHLRLLEHSRVLGPSRTTTCDATLCPRTCARCSMTSCSHRRRSRDTPNRSRRFVTTPSAYRNGSGRCAPGTANRPRHVSLPPPPPMTIDSIIAWINRDPRVGDLLREYEEIIHAHGPEVVAARVDEGKRFPATLPAGKAVELMSALAA